MNIAEIKIAYVATLSTTKGYIGAALVTDYKGYPVEFQYTDPILPTKIQQVLYGGGIEKYIKVDVILDSLLKILSNRIDLIIVQDEELLNYKISSVEILRASAAKKNQVLDENEITKVKNNEYIIKTDSPGGPVRLQFGRSIDVEDERFRKIVELVKEASKFIEIYEPVERVYKSVELITNQEV
ncbi:MAG: hypothetical protein WC197_06935 [Candidatus Gastranaerophilaceae bacterium]|jgi:hypothetical protein